MWDSHRKQNVWILLTSVDNWKTIVVTNLWSSIVIMKTELNLILAVKTVVRSLTINCIIWFTSLCKKLVKLTWVFSRSFSMPCASFSLLDGPGGARSRWTKQQHNKLIVPLLISWFMQVIQRFHIFLHPLNLYSC